MVELLFLTFGLFITHIMAEFFLQPNEWAVCKRTYKHRSTSLVYHSLLHGLVATIPVLFVTISIQDLLSVIAFVSATHWVIDLWKINRNERARFFIIEQLIHVVVLAVIAAHTTGVTFEQIAKLFTISDSTTQAAVVLFSYLLITKPVSVAITLVLKKYTDKMTKADNGENKRKGLIEGGQLIGYLERTLILTFTLLGSYAAIGFVLASKSVFRFGDLSSAQDRAATEYVIIGSMLSVTATVLLGILTTSIMKLLG